MHDTANQMQLLAFSFPIWRWRPVLSSTSFQMQRFNHYWDHKYVHAEMPVIGADSGILLNVLSRILLKQMLRQMLAQLYNLFVAVDSAMKLQCIWKSCSRKLQLEKVKRRLQCFSTLLELRPYTRLKHHYASVVCWLDRLSSLIEFLELKALRQEMLLNKSSTRPLCRKSSLCAIPVQQWWETDLVIQAHNCMSTVFTGLKTMFAAVCTTSPVNAAVSFSMPPCLSDAHFIWIACSSGCSLCGYIASVHRRYSSRCMGMLSGWPALSASW